jgi:hypothetical protein
MQRSAANMQLATLRLHPTDPNLVILAVPADLNSTIGRFEPARLSTQHKGYLVHNDHLDALGRFLALQNVAVADERALASQPTTTPAAWTRRPNMVLKCFACGYTQRDGPYGTCQAEECGNCNTCHNCGVADLRAHMLTVDEQIEINRRGLAKIDIAWMEADYVKQERSKEKTGGD